MNLRLLCHIFVERKSPYWPKCTKRTLSTVKSPQEIWNGLFFFHLELLFTVTCFTCLTEDILKNDSPSNFRFNRMFSLKLRKIVNRVSEWSRACADKSHLQLPNHLQSSSNRSQSDNLAGKLSRKHLAGRELTREKVCASTSLRNVPVKATARVYFKTMKMKDKKFVGSFVLKTKISINYN